MVEQRQKGGGISRIEEPRVGNLSKRRLQLILRRRLAQAFAAQAVLAIERHRQARRLLRAPAGPRERAGEFRSAPGTDDLARRIHF